MFSDSIMDSYLKIYDGIRSYRDYCSCQRYMIIKSMCCLLCVNYSFNMPKMDFVCTEEIIRMLQARAERDYNRALLDLPFC